MITQGLLNGRMNICVTGKFSSTQWLAKNETVCLVLARYLSISGRSPSSLLALIVLYGMPGSGVGMTA